jgi:hypothetical protein
MSLFTLMTTGVQAGTVSIKSRKDSVNLRYAGFFNHDNQLWEACSMWIPRDLDLVRVRAWRNASVYNGDHLTMAQWTVPSEQVEEFLTNLLGLGTISEDEAPEEINLEERLEEAGFPPVTVPPVPEDAPAPVFAESENLHQQNMEQTVARLMQMGDQFGVGVTPEMAREAIHVVIGAGADSKARALIDFANSKGVWVGTFAANQAVGVIMDMSVAGDPEANTGVAEDRQSLVMSELVRFARTYGYGNVPEDVVRTILAAVSLESDPMTKETMIRQLAASQLGVQFIGDPAMNRILSIIG